MCWDNVPPPPEAWFAGFKVGLVHPLGACTTRHEARVEIANYILWYDRTRRHSALDYSSPHQWDRIVTLIRAA